MIDFKEFLHLILLHISESSALQEGAFVLTVDLYLRWPEVGVLALSSSLQLVESREKSKRFAAEWQLSSLLHGCLGRDLGNT